MMQVRLRGRSMERVSGESSPLPPKRHGLRLLILNIVIMAQLTYVDLPLASANLHYYIYVNNVLPHLRYRPGKYEDPTKTPPLNFYIVQENFCQLMNCCVGFDLFEARIARARLCPQVQCYCI